MLRLMHFMTCLLARCELLRALQCTCVGPATQEVHTHFLSHGTPTPSAWTAILAVCSRVLDPRAQVICSGLTELSEVDERCNGGSPQGALLALLARLLFLENSRPVHRMLLACVRQLPPRLLALFAHAFERQACASFTSHILARLQNPAFC